MGRRVDADLFWVQPGTFLDNIFLIKTGLQNIPLRQRGVTFSTELSIIARHGEHSFIHH